MRLWPRRSRKVRVAPAPARRDFTRLPTQVRHSDLRTGQQVSTARDPRGGRDTERDFVIRYGDDFDDLTP